MTFRPRLALVAALVLLTPSLVSAQVWPSEVRRKFVDECLASCAVNTKFTSLQRAECPPYCECMVKEAQSFMSTEDYAAFREATAASKTTPFKERFEATGGICGKRVFR